MGHKIDLEKAIADCKLIADEAKEKFKYSSEGYDKSTPRNILGFSLTDGTHLCGFTGCIGGIDEAISYIEEGNFNCIIALVPVDKHVKEYAYQYIDYLIKRSAIANIFLVKNTDQVLEIGCPIDVNAGINELNYGLIALRGLSEHLTTSRLFCKFVEAGVSEHMAFMGAVHSSGSNVCTNSPGHFLQFGGLSLNSVKNYLLGKKTNTGTVFSSQTDYIRLGRASELFLEKSGKSAWFEDCAGKCVSPIYTSSSKPKNNPFASVTEVYDEDATVKVAVEFLTNLEKELLQ